MSLFVSGRRHRVEVEQLKARIERVEAQRDAAVEDAGGQRHAMTAVARAVSSVDEQYQREMAYLSARSTAQNRRLDRLARVYWRLRTDARVLRGIVAEHIASGLDHPDPAVQRQALALSTELDVARLNVDADVRALRAA